MTDIIIMGKSNAHLKNIMNLNNSADFETLRNLFIDVYKMYVHKDGYITNERFAEAVEFIADAINASEVEANCIAHSVYAYTIGSIYTSSEALRRILRYITGNEWYCYHGVDRDNCTDVDVLYNTAHMTEENMRNMVGVSYHTVSLSNIPKFR